MIAWLPTLMWMAIAAFTMLTGTQRLRAMRRVLAEIHAENAEMERKVQRTIRLTKIVQGKEAWRSN